MADSLDDLTIPELKKYAERNNIILPKRGSGARGGVVRADLVAAILRSKKSPKKIAPEPIKPPTPKSPQKIVPRPVSPQRAIEPSPKRRIPRSPGEIDPTPRKVTPRKISPNAPDDVYLAVFDDQQIQRYFISLDKLEKLFKQLTLDRIYYGRVLSVNCRVRDQAIPDGGDPLSKERFKKYDIIFSPRRAVFHSFYSAISGEQRLEVPRIRSIILNIAERQPIVI